MLLVAPSPYAPGADTVKTPLKVMRALLWSCQTAQAGQQPSQQQQLSREQPSQLSLPQPSQLPLQQPSQLSLPKHARYGSAYRRFGYYWGLGVEHETYIATSQSRIIRSFDAAALKPERYSVNYYAAYKPAALQTALQAVLADASGALTVPVLMNSHSFLDCDVFGEHRTTYERVPKPNPRFAGQTLGNWSQTYSAWLRDEEGRSYVWDGDTVEFITQGFYCATVADVMAELRTTEDRFVAELAQLPRKGILAAYAPLRLSAPANPGWATYLTHPRGVAMFNNGTFHVNVTLPTRLGWDRRPLWPADFVERHRRLARLVQWLEPLWIAAHGSGDPFCGVVGEDVSGFAAGSQRLAVSRYIGVGTFDTNTMPRGKVLQIQRSAAGQLPWYDWLHARTAYAPLDVIGLDINFNKHWSHGLELRIFDQIPLADLEGILRQVVVLMDVALESGAIPDPRTNVQWQRAAGESLLEGAAWRISPEQMGAICAALNIATDIKEPVLAHQALTWLFDNALRSRRGACWRAMVGGGEKKGGCLDLRKLYNLQTAS